MRSRKKRQRSARGDRRKCNGLSSRNTMLIGYGNLRLSNRYHRRMCNFIYILLPLLLFFFHNNNNVTYISSGVRRTTPKDFRSHRILHQLVSPPRVFRSVTCVLCYSVLYYSPNAIIIYNTIINIIMGQRHCIGTHTLHAYTTRDTPVITTNNIMYLM